MTSFAKWIGTSTIAAAALMLLAAQAPKAEEAGGAAMLPTFQIAQAEAEGSGKGKTPNPCAMGGGMMGGGMMGDGMMGDGMMGGGMMGGGAANPCGGMGGGMGGCKCCGMMGGDKSCGMMGGDKSCGMMSGDKSGDKYRSYKKMEPGMRAARLDEKLTSLKTAIEIRKDQEAAFKAFADALRARVKPTEEMYATLMKRMHGEDKPDALERLALREKKIAVRHENVIVLRQALGKLFTVLDEEQKKQADETLAQHRFRRLP